MNFPWSRAAHRANLLAEPFPASWLAALRADVVHFGWLGVEQQSRLRELTRIFVAEKNWEGCGGLTLTEEMRVVIAAQACLLILERGDPDVFGDVESVLVYPGAYVATAREFGPGRTPREKPEPRLGEAWSVGPVILSWPDALAGGRRQTSGNVVCHEFAHKLDFHDGASDGVPTLGDAAEYDRWASVMSAEFAAHQSRVQSGEPTLLGEYAATQAAEFFAVATERFFQTPRALSRALPALHGVLSGFFRQNPADWPCPDAGEDRPALEHSFP